MHHCSTNYSDFLLSVVSTDVDTKVNSVQSEEWILMGFMLISDTFNDVINQRLSKYSETSVRSTPELALRYYYFLNYKITYFLNAKLSVRLGEAK